MSYCKNCIFISLILFGLITVSFSQTIENSLNVTVKDQLDNVIPDAQITLFKSDKKERQIKSNKQGTGQFTKLSDGEFSITVTSKGFKDYKSESINLKTDEVKHLEIILEIAPVESEVVVDQADSVDKNDYGAANVLTQEDFKNLPDDPEEFWKAVRKIIGQSVTGEELPINVNGIEGGELPPKEMIEQIRVDRNIFSAKNAGSGGSGIEIITKAGMNKFRGTVNLGFADSRLNAGNPFLGKRVPSQSRSYRFSLSGPLGKKASFSFSVNHSSGDSGSVINAIILNSALQQVEYKQTFPTPRVSNSFQFMINYDPIKKHKLYLNYNFSSNSGKGQGVGNFSLPERAVNNDSQYHSLGFSHMYLPTPNFMSRTIFSASYRDTASSGGIKSPAINVSEAFSGGGSPSDSSTKNYDLSISNSTTHQFGKNSLEYGFSFDWERNDLISRSNFNGTYNFSGRIAPLLDENNNVLTDSNGNIITGQITSIESYRRNLLFRKLGYTGSQIRALGGGADQFTISGGNPKLSASQIEYDFYIDNSYKINESLSVAVGLRYENQTNINSNFNISPRFSVIWSPKSVKKKKPLFELPRISAGVGTFYSRFGMSNLISIRQANSDDRTSYFISNSAILDVFPNVPSLDLLEKIAQTKSRQFIDPKIQTPLQTTYNVSVNKKLLPKVGINFSFSYTRNARNAVTININAPLAGTYDPLNPTSAVYPSGSPGNIYQMRSAGRSESIRFFVNPTFPEFKLWGKQTTSFRVTYGFGKGRSNSVGGSGSPFDAYDFSREFAPTTSDGVHNFGGFINQTLPYQIGIGLNWSFQTGSRFNITTGRDTNGDGYYLERPAFASNPNKPGVVATKYGLLDPNPSPGDKIIPRNLGRGPSSMSADASIFKSFGFNQDKKNKKPPKQRLSIGIAISNVFNINNKGNPIGNMSSPNFVRIISGSSAEGGSFNPEFILSGGGFLSASNPRSMRFSLNFSF